MTKELLARCRDGCATAKKLGATAAEVFAQRTDEVAATIEKHDLQMARASEESAFGVRVLLGSQLGFACTNAVDELAAACCDAVALAKLSPRDAHHRMSAPRDAALVGGLCDPKASEFSPRRAVEHASRMLRIAEGIDRRLVVGDGAFSFRTLDRALANTLGVERAETTTLFAYHVLVTAKEDEQVSSMDFQFGACRSAAAVDVEPVVALACRNALDSLGSAVGETFRGDVILAPGAVLEILVAPLLFQMNARNVLRSLSRWGSEIGSTVASPTVTLVDDGTSPGGVASSSFDREGTPHEPLALLEEGRLSSFLHNAYTGAALGLANTGHASGGASSLPLIGPTNLTLLPGEATLEELVADTTLGLLVGRFSGNVDPVSGDFSGVAKAAHLVRRGKRVSPVAGTLIAGNAFDALRAISGISSAPQQIFGFLLPHVRVGEVSVSAG